MKRVLDRWNGLDAIAAAAEILPCCGSKAWAAEMAARRPVSDVDALLVVSDAVWLGLPESAWQEAFASHPRIGEQKAVGEATEESMAWSKAEQHAAMTPDETVKRRLEEGNRAYEERFGRIFLVRASGRTSEEILTLLEGRLGNDAGAELLEAAEQQRQITQLRLERWLTNGKG